MDDLLECNDNLKHWSWQLERNQEEGLEPWPVWLSWLEHCPINWTAAGSIPGQGTYPRLQVWHRWWVAHTRSNQSMFLSRIDVSLPLSLPFPFPCLSLKSISTFLGQDKKWEREILETKRVRMRKKIHLQNVFKTLQGMVWCKIPT